MSAGQNACTTTSFHKVTQIKGLDNINNVENDTTRLTLIPGVPIWLQHCRSEKKNPVCPVWGAAGEAVGQGREVGPVRLAGLHCLHPAPQLVQLVLEGRWHAAANTPRLPRGKNFHSTRRQNETRTVKHKKRGGRGGAGFSLGSMRWAEFGPFNAT